MVREMAPASRRRLGAHGLFLRRQRIFARLREGLSYAVESGADHAKLQLDRLAHAVQPRGEAIAAGDASAIIFFKCSRVAARITSYNAETGGDAVELGKHARLVGGNRAEAEGEASDLASSPEVADEANAPETSRTGVEAPPEFSYFNWP
jgi:hypothetical protein